jgi:branched-chain amino acid transport system permease protein
MSLQNQLLHAARWRVREIACMLLALVLPWLWPGQALLINEIAITALFAVSLDLILGYSGIVSLGHAAFFGVGAYAAALFAKHLNPDPLTGLVFAAGVSALTGWLASLTILRGSDLTRLMVTLGVSLIFLELANRFDGLTGGADGLQGVLMGPLLGWFEFDLQGLIAASYSVVVLLTSLIFCRRWVHSPIGFSLMAIRDNALRARAIGIPVASRLMMAYTLAACIAGVAGGLQAQTTGFASLDVFSFERSADVMLMLVIGGVGWLYGGVWGAVIFKVLQDQLASVTPQYWMFWIGLLLVVMMTVGRDRLKSWFMLGRRHESS